MKRYSVCFIVALITFVGGVGVTSLSFLHTSPKSEITTAGIVLPHTRSRSDEILEVLMPNGVWGDASQLDRFARAEEIQVLTEAQLTAKDARAVGIVFLLAALGHDYELNKGKLIYVLNQCANKSHPEYAQYLDFMAGYLMDLGRRGDASVLEPLFNVSDKADGAFAESLGTFYSDVLWRRPRQFIRALESRTKDEQRGFCSWAEEADGGGIEDGMLRDIRRSLKRMSTHSDYSLAPIARNCLSGLEAGHKLTVENNKSPGG